MKMCHPSTSIVMLYKNWVLIQYQIIIMFLGFINTVNKVNAVLTNMLHEADMFVA